MPAAFDSRIFLFIMGFIILVMGFGIIYSSYVFLLLLLVP